MMVALTVWDGRISPVFDSSRELLILEVQDGAVTSSVNEAIDDVDGAVKTERLVDLGVETLICGAISEPLRRGLNARGVDVVGFVAGDADEVLQAYLTGDLPGPPLATPTRCGRRRGLHAGGGRARGPGKKKRRGQGKRRSRGLGRGRGEGGNP